jgi:4-hydroxybenzoate polyprenyltransferase
MENRTKMNEPHIDAYYQQATAYCKTATFTWCVAGWVYAAITWHILWLPGILIFFPGIFIASIIAAVFFVPLWLVVKKVKTDWQNHRNKNWGLLVVATLLKFGLYLGPLAGAVHYVRLLKMYMK